MSPTAHPRLILASASPRRAAILRDAGFAFEVRPSAVDESPRRGESPVAHVKRLALDKARAVAQRLAGPAVVIGADTVVVVRGKILGKPVSPDDARRMLRLLSGKTHQVLTGVALVCVPPNAPCNSGRRDSPLHSGVETTRVTFAPLSKREIESYVATGEPYDKAGAYAVQGRAGKFVTRIEGCYYNVVGLPLARLYRMLLKMGFQQGGSKHKRRPKLSGRRKKN